MSLLYIITIVVSTLKCKKTLENKGIVLKGTITEPRANRYGATKKQKANHFIVIGLLLFIISIT